MSGLPYFNYWYPVGYRDAKPHVYESHSKIVTAD